MAAVVTLPTAVMPVMTPCATMAPMPAIPAASSPMTVSAPPATMVAVRLLDDPAFGSDITDGRAAAGQPNGVARRPTETQGCDGEHRRTHQGSHPGHGLKTFLRSFFAHGLIGNHVAKARFRCLNLGLAARSDEVHVPRRVVPRVRSPARRARSRSFWQTRAGRCGPLHPHHRPPCLIITADGPKWTFG